MINKYHEDVQKEINHILDKVNFWRNLFFITTEYYFDGWSIILQEKNIFPRRIVIFKSYKTNLYSIKSFEVHFNTIKNDKYDELYFIEKVITTEQLLKELKEIIYGKDLVKCVKEELIGKLS